MRVSIITATYNSAKTVRQTLRSVQSQTYKNIEHIIVDGGSSDNTLEIVGQFDHVSAVLSEEDGGIYDAMNKGIQLSTGKLIGILNSDDFYADNDVISDQIKKMIAENADCVYSDLEYVDPTGRKVVRKWKAGPFDRSKFLRGWMPPHPTVIARRNIYEDYGEYRLDLGTSADYEILLRWLYKLKLKCAYLARVTVRMRVGGISNRSMYNRFSANRMDKRAWKVNGIRPKWYTFILKPLRKVGQYF
ncbi:MAG: glycosyltransferase family 2 protein [Saprospiraceae bacterium]|nr:glycosyltransferase family 2 protein [Saprospiraceae bacterium]